MKDTWMDKIHMLTHPVILLFLPVKENYILKIWLMIYLVEYGN